MKLTEEEICGLNEALNDIEQDIEDRLAECRAALHPKATPEEVWGSDTFGEHELLDRLTCANYMIYQLLYEHDALPLHRETMKWVLLAGHAIEQAFVALSMDAFGEDFRNSTEESHEDQGISG